MGSLQRLFNGYLRARTRFQIMSDLHLEVGRQYGDFDIPAEAPYLILAGDIGHLKDYQPYLEFLQRQCDHFTKVFLVLGNHEFFGTCHAEGLRLARCLGNEPGCNGKLHVMNRDRLDLDASSCITILGCTLQSRIPADAKTTVQMKINDFKHIDNWTVDDQNSEHQRDVEWLQREIQKIRGEEHQPQRGVIVITHHAPTVNGTSKPSDLANPWSCAFSTDLLRDKALTDVQWWIFGHTHFSSEFKPSQVRLVSNQRGYVLNGVALQGRAPKPTTGSPFPRIMQMKSSNQRKFDVRKIIKI